MKKSNETGVESSTESLNRLKERFEDAVEMEVYVWTDEVLGQHKHPLADKIHRTLLRSLSDYSKVRLEPGSQGPSWRSPELKAHLVKEINDVSKRLLEVAIQSFETLASGSASLIFATGETDKLGNLVWYDLQPDDFHYYLGPYEAVAVVNRIRQFNKVQQLRALRYLSTMSAVDHNKFAIQYETYESGVGEYWSQLHRDKDELRNELEEHKALLSREELSEANTFYDLVESMSSSPYAFPVAFRASCSPHDLSLVGLSLRNFGNLLHRNYVIRIEGDAQAKACAEQALKQYRDLPHAYAVLGAWVVALHVIEGSRRCWICYRHAVAAHRCAEHLTRGKEVPEARLGIRVNPVYKSKLESLLRRREIRAVMRKSLDWNERVKSTEDAKLLEESKLSGRATTRAMVLLNQIAQLHPLLNDDMKQRITGLFEKVLYKVREIESHPPPNDNDKPLRKRQVVAASELLTLKGFFRVWYGSGDAYACIGVKMLKHDPGNPIAKGAMFDLDLLRHTLLSQRAWDEAYAEVTSNNMPSKEMINEEASKGMRMRDIASKFGIALSTVYKILNRNGERKRKFYKSAPV